MSFNKRLVKEIVGIVFLFIILFSIISLLSYNCNDSSIFQNQECSKNTVKNLFGFLGSSFAGILIPWFGLGSLWIPLLMIILIIRVVQKKISFFLLLSIISGGVLLIVTTGSIFLIKQDEYSIFNHHFSAGGLVGSAFSNLIVRYSNKIGGVITLSLMWVIGFIMTTNLSITSGYNFLRMLIGKVINITKRTKFRNNFKNMDKKEAALPRKQIALSVNYEDVKFVEPPIVKIKNKRILKHSVKYNLPGADLLESEKKGNDSQLKINTTLEAQSELLNNKLRDFGVKGKIVAANPGPVVTTFEYEPAVGVKLNKIVNLVDDLTLAMRTISLRIIAPIPGKPVVGIEVPNVRRKIVKFKEIATSLDFLSTDNNLPLCLGKGTHGEPVSIGLDKMPHLLIAGATGTGKSVALNTMICSLLYKLTPKQVRLILVDPKGVELSSYSGIPHLITPVVTDVKVVIDTLAWIVQEMKNRYKLFTERRVKHIVDYNNKAKIKNSQSGNKYEKIPYIVVVIDELADLMMMSSSSNVEAALSKIAQMARAAGIHLILATQRPSSDVLTGTIKANFPARLTFKVSSKIDSRTIVDTNGAESLLGNGDMLFMSPNVAKLRRIHGAYVSEMEIANITNFVKQES